MEDLADMFDNGMQAQFLDDEPKNSKKLVRISVNPLSKKLEVEAIAHPKIVAVTDFDECIENMSQSPPMFNDSISTKLSKKLNTCTSIAKLII